MSNSREPYDREKVFYAERGQGRGYGRGRGKGRGYGRGRGRGRPPVAYPIETDMRGKGSTNLILSSFELQILQMADIQELTQNEIGDKLQISQTSVWRYLKSARTKIAKAVAENKQIYIEIID